MSDRTLPPAVVPQPKFAVTYHTPTCNMCGSTKQVPFCPENERGLVQCSDCGLVFVGARPDSQHLYELYSETYFHNNKDSGTLGYSDYLHDEPNIRKTSNRRLARLEKFVRPGKMLDVGCATGFFLAEAQRRGWQTQGLDVSAFAIKYARDTFKLDVQHGSLTDLDYPANTYDAVTLWDVIEHVTDPKSYLARAAELLKPGGYIALATPDVGSLPAKLTGKRWVGYKLSEEHLYYFSTKTLANMLNEVGFDVVEHYHVGKYVTLQLFLDRLNMYTPILAKPAQMAERAFHLSEWSLYVNPMDIVSITARKR